LLRRARARVALESSLGHKTQNPNQNPKIKKSKKRKEKTRFSSIDNKNKSRRKGPKRSAAIKQSED
jgi:hypothetical protein